VVLPFGVCIVDTNQDPFVSAVQAKKSAGKTSALYQFKETGLPGWRRWPLEHLTDSGALFRRQSSDELFKIFSQTFRHLATELADLDQLLVVSGFIEGCRDEKLNGFIASLPYLLAQRVIRGANLSHFVAKSAARWFGQFFYFRSEPLSP
jgi:hypothetical protein